MSCSRLVRRLKSGRGPEMSLLAKLRMRRAVKSPKMEGSTPLKRSLLVGYCVSTLGSPRLS
jgi:hypothetical protein